MVLSPKRQAGLDFQQPYYPPQEVEPFPSGHFQQPGAGSVSSQTYLHEHLLLTREKSAHFRRVQQLLPEGRALDYYRLSCRFVHPSLEDT